MFLNLATSAPNPDAIQEFSFQTNNYSAKFGGRGGGVVNMVTKSGSNGFHGSLYEYFRNDKLNANSWSNNFNTTAGVWNPLPKSKLRWNMFGATLGGPILKNKLFFFVDYQGQRFDIPSSFGTKNVFTAAERTGDFSALCPAGFTGGVCSSTANGNEQLYNPCASFTAPCTPSSPQATTRMPFPNNQIPLAMISPVAQNLFNSALYPKAIGTGLQQNAVNTTASAFNVNQGDINPCIIVDDIIRSGHAIEETVELVRGLGAPIIGCGAIVRFTSAPEEIEGVPIKSLVEFDEHFYDSADACMECKAGAPEEHVRF